VNELLSILNDWEYSATEGAMKCNECGGVNVMLKDLPLKITQDVLKKYKDE
jgi:hypothetical protein